MNKKLKTRPKTDQELVDEMNRQLKSGVFYATSQLYKLCEIARKRKCKISELPLGFKQKVFSE